MQQKEVHAYLKINFVDKFIIGSITQSLPVPKLLIRTGYIVGQFINYCLKYINAEPLGSTIFKSYKFIKPRLCR
jgi:hypothetical protein